MSEGGREHTIEELLVVIDFYFSILSKNSTGHLKQHNNNNDGDEDDQIESGAKSTLERTDEQSV